MKIYLGVTDNDWFRNLSQSNPEDVNFWQPKNEKKRFRALPLGAPFLFKLKAPLNAIGGVGFFSSQTFLPLSVVWDTFGIRNGFGSIEALQRAIQNHRGENYRPNPTISCIALTNPVFFKQEDWIPTPENWGPSTMQGKKYETEERIGGDLWLRVEALLKKYLSENKGVEPSNEWALHEPEPQYREVLTRVRMGQGAFRVLVTDAYKRRCAITGEKTLPVLEAAHIKPYVDAGPHFLSNGILLRSDMHKLFDCGYLTIAPDLKIEISGRIKTEFENGKEYYQYHGKLASFLPERAIDRPDAKYIDWHNTKVFKA